MGTVMLQVTGKKNAANTEGLRRPKPVMVLNSVFIKQRKKGGDHTANRPQFFTADDSSVLWRMPVSGTVPDSHFQNTKNACNSTCSTYFEKKSEGLGGWTASYPGFSRPGSHRTLVLLVKQMKPISQP